MPCWNAELGKANSQILGFGPNHVHLAFLKLSQGENNYRFVTKTDLDKKVTMSLVNMHSLGREKIKDRVIDEKHYLKIIKFYISFICQ